MKLEIDLNAFVDPPTVARRPSGDWSPVPSGFLNALVNANKFVASGKRNAIYPWVKYIYLLKGRLYASDHRCIVEIKVGGNLGDVQFTSDEINILMARGAEPNEALFHAGWTAFAWPDDSWCKIDRRDSERNVNFSHAIRCRALIKQFWHEGRSANAMRAPILIDVKRQSRRKIIKFNRGRLGETADQYWHGGSIEKAMKIAETFDPDASPAPFSFPNGKGLIVKPRR